MAVAVKNTPGTSATSPLARPGLVGLLGAFYVVASLGLIFKGLPILLEMLGAQPSGLVGGSLLAVLMLVTTVGLLWLGGQLLGTREAPGVRAGIFVGAVGLLLVLLLTRWASVWFEHAAYSANLFAPTVGAILTGVTGVVLLGAMCWGYFQPWMQKQILALDDGGWFKATPYKPLQGVRVRRGTILGLVILVLSGIYTLVSHETLGRVATDWQLDIPFTGTVAITNYGDTREWLEELPPAAKDQIEVTFLLDANATDLEPGSLVSAAAFRKAVKSVLEQHATLAGRKIDPESEITKLLEACNEQVYSGYEELLTRDGLLGKAAKQDLQERDAQTSWGDLTPLLEEIKRKTDAADIKPEALPAAMQLPTGALVVNRYTLRDLNARTDPSRFIRVGLNTEPDFAFKEGAIVETAAFDAEVAKEKEKRKDFRTPEKVALVPASGQTHFASLTLVPSVQYTLPLLLLAVALWLSWRFVNMPAFADFLIATEAELNKVSWTTQRRLVQDTIVVLVTVALMAVYLFGVDQIWRVSLSWKPIGVLVFEEGKSDTNVSADKKKW